jgi:hypothetical protein
MRTVLAICFALVGVATVAAQDYQSPAAPLPSTVSKPIDTSAATQGATTLPAAPDTAKAQTPGAKVETPPAQANTQQK